MPHMHFPGARMDKTMDISATSPYISSNNIIHSNDNISNDSDDISNNPDDSIHHVKNNANNAPVRTLTKP